MINSNKPKIIGNNKYGERPYLISEITGHFVNEVIIYSYTAVEALDTYVDNGEKEYGWEVPELEEDEVEEGNYIYAKGYYPIDLDYVTIQEIE